MSSFKSFAYRLSSDRILNVDRVRLIGLHGAGRPPAVVGGGWCEGVHRGGVERGLQTITEIFFSILIIYSRPSMEEEERQSLREAPSLSPDWGKMKKWKIENEEFQLTGDFFIDSRQLSELVTEGRLDKKKQNINLNESQLIKIN